MTIWKKILVTQPPYPESSYYLKMDIPIGKQAKNTKQGIHEKI